MVAPIFGSKALAPKAPDTSGQVAAAREANALQRQIYEESVERGQPFYDVGLAGSEKLSGYLGLDEAQRGNVPEGSYGSLLQSFSPDQLTEDPGFAFRQAEGNKALERQLASQGKTFSPEAAKALMGYNQGLASQEYGQAYDRYRADQGDIYNRLAALSGTGQQQISQLNQAGQSYAGNVGQTNASLADAQVAAQQAKNAGKQSMFNTLLSGGAMLGAAAISDERLKENVVRVGEKNGFGLFQFNYKGDDKTYEGVIAQEVQRKQPDAIIDMGDALAVDCEKIGIEMKEVN